MKLCNRFILAFTVLSLHALHPANASDDSYGSVLVDEVTSIYDGDTFRVNINSMSQLSCQAIFKSTHNFILPLQSLLISSF